MAFFDHIVLKVSVSFVIALVSILYQLESQDEFLIADKLVLLSKNKSFVFDTLTNLEGLPVFYPNVLNVEAVNDKEYMSIGKRFTVHSTYIFGISESQSQLTVIGLQKPTLVEFLVDDFLKIRNRVSFIDHSKDENKSYVKWEIYSRRKSYLFKASIGLLYQFYHNQLLREALFSLQFMIKDAK